MKRVLSLVIIFIMTISSFQYVFAFSDTRNHWAEEIIDKWRDEDVINGDGDGYFRPDDYITRAEFTKVISEANNYARQAAIYYTDVPKNEWFYEPISKAASVGIVNGYGDNSFRPNNYITREEAAVIFGRAYEIDSANQYGVTFTDRDECSSWALSYVRELFGAGLIIGYNDGSFRPQNPITRAETLQILDRIEYPDTLQQDEDVEYNDFYYEPEPIKEYSFRNTDEINSVSVEFSDNRDASNVRISEINESDLIYNTTGLKGYAVSITSNESFDKATISFDYNPDGLGDTEAKDLAVGWYNTDLDRIELLKSKVNTAEHTVSVETNHFSEYVLVDSKEWYSIWQMGQTIVRETDSSGNYAEDFSVQMVIDCSGSMSGDKLTKAKECTYNFIDKLSENDKFSVTAFDDSASPVIPDTIVKEADMSYVRDSVMNLNAGGGTNFNAALNACISTLEESRRYNNIIVFLSDGQSSADDSILQQLKDLGVRVAAVALGSDASTANMQKISDSTNGQYIYAEDSSALDMIYEAIQGSLIGVDSTDTDGDGIPDIIETTGMKNQYGSIIRTDPNKYDTDGDGVSDGVEMGKLIETDVVTELDRERGITSCVYFQMVSDPVEGHAVSGMVDANVNVSVSKSNINSAGEFELYLTLDVTGQAKDICIEFDIDDCKDIEMSNYAEFANTDYDGRLTKNTLSAGEHNLTIFMLCLNMQQGIDCGNSHEVTVTVSGSNFDTVTASTDERGYSSQNDIYISSPTIAANEFNNSIEEFITELAAFTDSMVGGERQKLKNEVTGYVKKIPFNVDAIMPNPTTAEKAAIEECFYYAVFDFYMAKAMENEQVWGFDVKGYYDNISPDDFSDGCISAATQMVVDTGKLVSDLLRNDCIEGRYGYGKYEYDVKIESDITGGTVIIATFTTDSGTSYKYYGTTGENIQNSISGIESAMIDYLNELLELYKDANKGAALAAVNDIKKTVFSDDFKIKPVSVKLDNMISEKFEQWGVSEVDQFIGECIDVHNITKNWNKFLSSEIDPDKIENNLNELNSIYKSMDEYITGAFESGGNGGNRVSAKSVNNIRKKVKENLYKLIESCEAYIYSV